MRLTAQKRVGDGSADLRRSGRLPAVVYNKELNLPVSIDYIEFDKVFRSQGTSHVIDLDVDGETHEVLVKEVQMNKRRRVPQHVDFYAVTAGQAVDVYVQVDYQGTPQGVKEGGQLDVQRREILVRVLPRLIPEKLEYDVTHLEIGDSVHISDVAAKLPDEAEILDSEELTLITVLAPRVIEEPEAAEAEVEEAEPEVIGRGGEEEEEAGEEEAGEE